SRLLRDRSAILKSLLMDQSFAAGVGNWIADEVLYQAKIDPRRRACDLTDAEARRVRSRLKSVVARAVAVDADKTRFPRTWLFHRRWGRDESATTTRGDAIAFVTIGGRTTAWVPGVQG
ncbi:MAG: DNA-formamidopyrimidine glycosylase, partial [Phycisphaerales bacterium]|nr:DNA-formamidopyrimidine glycosylase [Phycisphaerales bacterium]